jgi:FtsP/CotA-like multicopper oxidase with cupredoxin domain
MYLHGMPMLVTHKDGYAQPQPWLCDTLNVAPGERWDVMIDCDNPARGPSTATSSPTPRGRWGCSGW